MQATKTIEVRDMAIVHSIFRGGFVESAMLVRAAQTPSPERVAFLADHIELGVAALHHHHEAEDTLLYPTLVDRVPEQAEVTEHVDKEHVLIQSGLEAVSAACAAWRKRPSAETREALAAAIDDLHSVTLPHLDHEEQ